MILYFQFVSICHFLGNFLDKKNPWKYGNGYFVEQGIIYEYNSVVKSTWNFEINYFFAFSYTKKYITVQMINFQFRNKTDFLYLCRDEKLNEKSYFFWYPTGIEHISVSFDIDSAWIYTIVTRKEIVWIHRPFSKNFRNMSTIVGWSFTIGERSFLMNSRLSIALKVF